MAATITKPATTQIADPKTGQINQTWLTQLGAAFDAISGPFPLRRLQSSTLPSAAKYSGCIAYVPDAAGGPCVAVSDGTNWTKIKLGKIVT